MVEVGGIPYAVDGVGHLTTHENGPTWFGQHDFRHASDIGLVEYGWGSSAHGGHSYSRTNQLIYAVVGGMIYGDQPVEAEDPILDRTPVVRVWPTPFRDVLTVDVGGVEPAIAEVEVFGVLGRRVLYTEIVLPGTRQVDTSALAPGTYVIRALLDDGTVLTRTVTKAR